MSADVTQLRPSWVRKIEITRVEGVSIPGECWLWRGALDKVSGYGRVIEAVSPMTNSRRGIRGSQAECQNGHLLSGENLYINQGRKPQYVHRVCRTCRAEYLAEWRAKQKQRKADTWAMYAAQGEVGAA